MINYLKRLPNSAPYAVTKFTSNKVRSLISAWDRQRRFDVLVCDFLSASLNFEKRFARPLCFFNTTLNQRFGSARRNARRARSSVLLSNRSAKMSPYERATVRRFQHRDRRLGSSSRELMSAMTDASRISVVPTGVDLAEYGALTKKPRPLNQEPNVLFLGSMDWKQTSMVSIFLS